MAIDVVDVPAERTPFVSQWLNTNHIVNAAIQLETVAIDDGYQAAYLVMRGGHGRFPHLALLHFTVADHDKRGEVLTEHTPSHRHAQPAG
ncbi:hypothetical protein D3C81_1662520 [compost metagenome]